MSVRMCVLAAMLCGTLCALPAQATPFLSFTNQLLPSGNTQWTVYFNVGDGLTVASAFDLKAETHLFTHLVHEVAFGSLPVDDYGNAANFDPIDPGYSLVEDTWVDAGAGSTSGFTVSLPSIFAGNNGGAGGTDMDPAGAVTSGTAAYASWGTAGGTGQGPGPSRIMQFVVAGDYTYVIPNGGSNIFSVQGVIARGGSSAIPVDIRFGILPEPDSILLLMCGTVGLLFARLRRRS